MSASSEKKNRKAAREAGTDKKLIAQQKEATESAKSRRRWIIGGVLVALFIVTVLFLNSGLLFTATTAVTINGRSYSPAVVSYYYGTQYSTYSSYASYYGMDVSQLADEETLMSSALEQMEQIQALCDYAKENGIELTEEEIAEVDADIASMSEQVIAGGYKDLNSYYSYNFGTGVSAKLARQLVLEQTLANKAYNAKLDSLEYTPEELEAYYAGLNGESDSFTYDYYFVYADTVDGEPDEEGNVTSSFTDETMAEAKATAEAIKAAYEESEGDDCSSRFAEAVASVASDTSSSTSGLSGSSINDAFKSWMMDSSRKAGDITVAENSSAGGYYAVMFLDRSDNHYNTVSMRHILIKAVEDENGEYTDDAIAEAHASAEAIFQEWKSGEATEDSFAALANDKSEDASSNTTGGLFENIYQGQMVSEINDYIFGSRKAGDVQVIDVVSSGYTGTHVVYFIGEGGLYSDYLAEQELSTDAMTSWSETLYAGYTSSNGWAYGLIRK